MNESIKLRSTDRSAPLPRLPLTDDRAWSVGDVAYFLGYSESEVRKLERYRQLPSLPRHCNRITFDPRVVRAFRGGVPVSNGTQTSLQQG